MKPDPTLLPTFPTGVLERLARLPDTRLRPPPSHEGLIALISDLMRRPWFDVGAKHYLDDYLRSERLSRTPLLQLQKAKLRRLVWHCFLHVPGYAGPIAEILKPAEIEVLDALERLPIVDSAARRSGDFRARVTEQDGDHAAELAARRIALRLRAARWRSRQVKEADEVGVYAASCEVGDALHAMADHLLVEVVDEKGGPAPVGEVGHVLITDLHNYNTPYLRFDIGVRGRLRAESCRCGRVLPLVELTGER